MTDSKPQWQDGALRADQQRRDRRYRAIAIAVLAVLAVVLAGGVLWAVFSADDTKAAGPASPSSSAPTVTLTPSLEPLDQASAPSYTPTATALAGVKAPSGARPDGGIPIGESGKAGTDNGSGAVVVDVYLDYLCPMCTQFDDVNGAMLDRARESGEVTEVLHPVAILDRRSGGSMYSTRAAAAAGYVADRAPEAFGEFHDLLFANQPAEGSSGLSDERIQKLAEAAGVPEDVAAGIGDGTAVKEFGDWVNATTSTAVADESLYTDFGSQKGFGTPTIVVGGKKLDGDWTHTSVLQDAILAAKR